MFVFGAWSTQQLVQLPGLTWLVSALCLVVLIAYAKTHPSFFSSHTSSRFLKQALTGAAAFLLGVCWASSFAYWRLNDALPSAWEQKTIVVEGIVASVPEATERGERFNFDVEKILTKGAVVPKRVSLNDYHAIPDEAPPNTEEKSLARNHFRAGERWQLSVRLKRPHGTLNPHGFDFESWALAENIRANGSIKTKADAKKLADFVWQPAYIVLRLREQVQQRIIKVLADKPYAGIIEALVMGDDSQISVADWQVFLRTGTSHLMSISGLHITMLAGLAFAVVSFFWRRNPWLMMYLPTRKAASVAGVMVALAYALIAGFSVPSQRTFYMLLVLAVAVWTGRQWLISQVLTIALMLVVVLDPWAVIAPGFWLSFGAVAMLAYALGGRVAEAHWLKAALKTQYAVTVGMLPLLLVMFGQVSIISPVANAIAIPIISFIVTPLALLGSFLPIDYPLYFAYQALDICMSLLKWLNQSQIVTWQQHEPAAWTFVPAMLGVLWLLLPRGIPMRYLGFLGFLPMLFIVPPPLKLGDMNVTVLDVGQGLSVVVQTAQHSFVYDTGPQYNAQSDAGSRIVVPFLRGEGIERLDGLMVSHHDIDHSGGMMSVLSLMPVSWLDSSFPKALTVPSSTKNLSCFRGQRWVWDEVIFEVLYPGLQNDDPHLKDNHRSCVLKVGSRSGSVLLTGDIEAPDEQALLNTQVGALKSDVMVVPHHGSKTSSTPEFISAVAPSISIFTNGYLNRFGHPKALIFERYKATKALLYRSDYHGAVQMQFAHRRIEVTSARKQLRRYWHDVF